MIIKLKVFKDDTFVGAIRIHSLPVNKTGNPSGYIAYIGQDEFSRHESEQPVCAKGDQVVARVFATPRHALAEAVAAVLNDEF